MTACLSTIISRPRLWVSYRLFLLSRCTSNERSPQGTTLSRLKASVILPPEILSKIFEHIPTSSEGRGTLMACALVATWWTGPSQRRLFSSVEIHESNHARWMDGVVLSGSKAHLLGYVRSLCHSPGQNVGFHRIQDLARESNEYLSALRNLRSLTLRNARIEHIHEDLFHISFSAFRVTLTHLSLETFSTSFSALISFIVSFPNITSLKLDPTSVLVPDEGPVPLLSRPLRGKLHLSGTQHDCLEFFNRFAEVVLGYEELVIDRHSMVTGAVFAESALRTSLRAIKILRLTAEPICK